MEGGEAGSLGGLSWWVYGDFDVELDERSRDRLVCALNKALKIKLDSGFDCWPFLILKFLVNKT